MNSMPPLSDKRGRAWSQAVKLIVTAAIILYLVFRADLTQVGALVRNVEIPLALVALLLLCGRNVMQAVRWRLVLTIMQQPLSWLAVIRLTFIGIFFTLFLPTAVGGDLVRGYLATKRGLEGGRAVSSLVVDRLLGVFATSCLAGISAFLVRETILSPTVRIGLLVLPLGFLALIWALLIRPGEVSEPGRAASWWRRLARMRSLTAAQFRTASGTFATAFGCSLAANLLAIVGMFAASEALGAQIPLLTLAMFLPLVWILMMLPISIGGLGVREGSLVFFLGLAGVNREMALGICLLWLILTLTQAIVGGLLFALEGVKLSEIRR